MSSTKLCIITTNKKVYSETFIRNHIDKLPFWKKTLYNGHLPVLYEWNTDRPLSNLLLYKIRTKFFANASATNEKYISKYLPQYLKQNKIQVVLAEFGPVGAHVQNACIKANIPLIVHFHGDDAHAHTYKERYQSYQGLLKHAHAVICVSVSMHKQLKEYGFTDKQLHLIPYGIDTSFFSSADPLNAPPVFVSVGRFVDKKAPHLTILAFEKVLKRVPYARLIMIGTGPLLMACKELAYALGISKNIEFKGVCNQEEVQQTIRGARAFVMHSVTPETGEKEGTPLSVLEASASGLPIISTFHAGIAEAVVHNKTGFLVDEYDFSQMAEFMVQLAETPELAMRMGGEGRKHISQNYELKKQIAKLASVIEQTANPTL
ncbi:colanic acid/amylovoran biosynthesis glycosyltransferase [Catalinimonas alkaloidigena]|uniref:glycosyltransferase n=1 Tax=Catalinimonas alkaloidigena TaxID=1075417 RepID=UPI002407277C|nr:glycosyltransferase [Catalinimonas alkaloidigena]MDF9801096.1 colanic acid/amylovoran biosynthesis glycosyltransferase [Catalinimonas alkaloidigena]